MSTPVGRAASAQRSLMTYLDQALDMLRLKGSRSAETLPVASFSGLDDLFGEAMAYLSASR